MVGLTIDNRDNRIRQVLAAEQAWARAHLTLDLEAMAGLMADSYRHYAPDGSVVDRHSLLSSYGSGDRRWQVAESSGHEVELYGDCAVVSGTWRGCGVNDGTPFDYTARFIALYVERGDSWQLQMDIALPGVDA